MISIKQQFLFVHATKTAGSSVIKALKPYASKPETFWYNRILDSLTIRVTYFGPLQARRFRTHASAAIIKRHLPADTYHNLFKFGFIRNPWDQLVSHYHYIQQYSSHHRSKQVAKLSFPEFVKMWINKGKVDHSKMFYNHRGEMLVDFLGRFETLDRDFKSICRHLNLDVTLPRENASSHRDYREYYDEDLKQYVADKLHREIEYFGYSFDPESNYNPILSPQLIASGGLNI